MLNLLAKVASPSRVGGIDVLKRNGCADTNGSLSTLPTFMTMKVSPFKNYSKRKEVNYDM